MYIGRRIYRRSDDDQFQYLLRYRRRLRRWIQRRRRRRRREIAISHRNFHVEREIASGAQGTFA